VPEIAHPQSCSYSRSPWKVKDNQDTLIKDADPTRSNDQDTNCIGPSKRLNIDRKNKKPGKDSHLAKLGGPQDPQILTPSHGESLHSSIDQRAESFIVEDLVPASNRRKSHTPVHLVSLDAIAICCFPYISQGIRRINRKGSNNLDALSV